MEDIVWVLIAALIGAVMYFIGSMTSPHAKAYKVQAQTWQGQYSGLKKQLIEVNDMAEDKDPIMATLKQLGVPKAAVPFVKQFAETKIQEFLNASKKGDNKDGNASSVWGP